jgi:hypothetical protein
MRRLLFPMLAVVVFIPMGVSAQQAITIEVLQVELWPEYDRPEMLVIYHIELSADTPFPTTLSIRIPAAAGEPFVVAVEGLGEIDYQRRVEDEWAVITFVSPGPKIQLEYYDPSLARDGNRRSFIYTWPGDYPVNDFQIIAQLPFDATSFETMPALDNEVAGVNGLSYREGAFGSLSVGQQPSIMVEYQKASDVLSVDNPATAGSADEVSQHNDWLVALLVAVGVGLIGYGVYIYTQNASGRRRERRLAGGAQETVFCHQCGARAQKGDKFCRACGQKLRM